MMVPGAIAYTTFELPVLKMAVSVHCDMNSAASLAVTLSQSFTSVDTYEVFLVPGTASTGGTVNQNISFVKASANSVVIKTGNGAVGDGTASPRYVDLVAIGY